MHMHMHACMHTHTHTHAGHFGIQTVDNNTLQMFLSLVGSRTEDSSRIVEISNNINTIQSDFQNFQSDLQSLKNAHIRMEEELKKMTNRQDLVFMKQDLIQSTLAGELPPPSHPFSKSPSVTPSIAWSTHFSSPH